MSRIFASLCLFCAISLFAPRSASAVTIAWTPVGNPGNAADTTVRSDGTTGYGAVGYSFNIDKYDVTTSQYAEFLNATDPTGANAHSMYYINMGISFNAGNANGSKYSVPAGDGNHPVDNVTWFDAIRFTNWLNNGQGNGSTEGGAYNLGNLGTGGVPINDGNGIKRNAGAKVFLPNENEWYKAAYYNPATRSYFQYPTSSNTPPTASGPTALANHANFSNAAGGDLTDVGAYTGTTSPYGAFDMGGDVWQWNETLAHPFDRGWLGGSDSELSSSSLSSFRDWYDPSYGVGGFRVASIASIPEPSTRVLAVLACGLMWWKRKSFRRVA